ncbi:class I SAM-dependent methyltransferase [Phormidium sp. FACHB-1136]|nr:class I SAM-dependent methyltransferase [Phormidium sp. FACHB-1136]
MSRTYDCPVDIQRNAFVLDAGCGRGEFLKGFIECGLQAYAVDQSSVALRYLPDARLKVSNIETGGIPYPDNYFDVVYSKSVIEHFHYPERFVREIYRVLKPGGLVITMCPAWEYNYRIYFEDYTHRTPFMLGSLRDILLIHGFENIQVEFFRQLPILWSGWGRWLVPLAKLTRVLTPTQLSRRSKWVRFSKEVMLLSSARKPDNEP